MLESVEVDAAAKRVEALLDGFAEPSACGGSGGPSVHECAHVACAGRNAGRT